MRALTLLRGTLVPLSALGSAVRVNVTILRRTIWVTPFRMHTSGMRRRSMVVMVVLGVVATGCGSKSQEEIFRQAGVDAATANAWSQNDCHVGARAEVDSQIKSHPDWTTTQRNTYEAAYVDGCLSALKPLQGTAQ